MSTTRKPDRRLCVVCLWRLGFKSDQVDASVGRQNAVVDARALYGEELVPRRRLGGPRLGVGRSRWSAQSAGHARSSGAGLKDKPIPATDEELIDLIDKAYFTMMRPPLAALKLIRSATKYRPLFMCGPNRRLWLKLERHGFLGGSESQDVLRQDRAVQAGHQPG